MSGVRSEGSRAEQINRLLVENMALRAELAMEREGRLCAETKLRHLEDAQQRQADAHLGANRG